MHLGYAVLVLTDPKGMSAGRYWITGSRNKHFELSEASTPTNPAQMLVRTGTRSQTAQPHPSDLIRHREQAVADRERLLGTDHPDTLTARCDLGLAYASVGRTAEATHLLRQVIADRERLLGTDHPDTSTARAHLVLAESSGRKHPPPAGLA
ncbi:tetratricopeptide repeat protein [Couchioplanes caeruleus]|uniref:Tetratricopeptide repeat protein n=1 Tax=Couchioplanes caeruleus TaxID=56438 RepID=A0A3N1GI51_9ACTN|nr:tetratricopeptide repeat protein [Couchioplanes caeruleus]